MIRRPFYQLITAKYEVFETEESDAPVGKASVSDGFIESLLVQKGAPERYRGQILNRLMRAILEDADLHNSNVSIKVAAPDALRLKRFLERYGFRETHESVFKRNAGASLPPSVIY
jgi:hypothetical protein